MAQARLVYIAGSGHSGSTLLNLILNRHSAVSALSEIHRLSASARSDQKEMGCGCGRAVLNCAFWNRVADELRALCGSQDPDILVTLATNSSKTRVGSGPESLMRMLETAVHRGLIALGSRRLCQLGSQISGALEVSIFTSLLNSLTVFEAIRRSMDTPVIVDASKYPVRMKGLYLLAKEPFNALHLVRDGRAVCYSRMRRERVSMEVAAHKWVQEYRGFRLYGLTIPPERILKVHYEELALNSMLEVKRVCTFLGLEFESRMLDFRGGEHHVIGGNPMRFQNERKIVVDASWKHQVSSSDLRSFSHIAGRLNRRLGYE